MRHSATLRFAVIALVISGCATTPQQSAPISDATDEAKQWVVAVAEGKIDHALTLVSEDFAGTTWSDKAALADYLHTAQQRGYFNNASVSNTRVKVTVDGDGVRVGPLHMRAQLGTAVFALQLKQEENDWRIISLDMEIY